MTVEPIQVGLPTEASGQPIAWREEISHESAMRFQALIENSTDIVSIHDGDGALQYATPAFEKTLGYRLEDCIGKNMFEFIHPADVAEASNAFRRVIERANPRIPTEFRIRHANGSWVPVESIGNYLLADPNVRGVVIDTRDVSDRKNAEAKYRKLVEQREQALVQAYDTTLEGWSRALDMRDKETQGHTDRVVELTLRLARVMGLSEAELVHIRRGALLHDIGKLGVPDRILHKPGPLTDEEWDAMRKHPTFAYDLLSPIEYLRPALDIPFCHHEKWDGTGYPRGLKGEEIPLVARIFMIVDVWDGLRHDRPYRAARSLQETKEYIESESDRYFDPEVVRVFLRLIDQAETL